MTLQAQYFQLVTIETPNDTVASIDEYNTVTYGMDSSEVWVALSMDSSSEDENDRNTLTDTYTMICDPDVNINQLSTVTWIDAAEVGHETRVMGKPLTRMLRAQLHHLEVQLTEVIDGTGSSGSGSS